MSPPLCELARDNWNDEAFFGAGEGYRGLHHTQAFVRLFSRPAAPDEDGYLKSSDDAIE